jgi:hypothetical protein
MTSPVLFQHVEPNFTNSITMAVFQKADNPHVLARQATLEAEIRTLIATGEEHKVFLNPQDGLWFGGISSILQLFHLNQGSNMQIMSNPS